MAGLQKQREYEDDDGRVIADMSDLKRQPLLVPQFDRPKERQSGVKNGSAHADDTASYEQTVTVTREERNAMIKGGVAAGLLIVGAVAAGFALLIFLVGHMGY